jgi:hypothetical protein
MCGVGGRPLERAAHRSIGSGMLRLMIAASGALAVGSCDGGPAPCPTVLADAQIQVPASSIAPSIIPSFPSINAATTAAPAGVMVSIVANQGTVSYGGRGPFPAFIYDRGAIADDILYGGLGVMNGVWFPFWLYCTADGRLTDIFGEMSDRDTDVFPTVEGTCTIRNDGYMTTVSVPAHTLSPVALTCGFTVTAPAPDGLDLTSSKVGTGYLWGDVASVYPFHAVDCRSGCGSPGWYELHSIIWDPAKQVAAFGIFYLEDRGVSLGGNGIALPTGQNAGDGMLVSGATYSLTR